MRPISELPQAPLLKPSEIAPFLGCGPDNVTKLWRIGRLRGRKTGYRTLLIERESVIEYVEELSNT
ncbi:helix-turn-helix domain-containing protein [Nitrospinae bacterium AH_259_B05_G02_I21]|nr:helix-turn-helix domain-containing protein [Nitrospinae bacterium AH_259_B05_G02_I21]